MARLLTSKQGVQMKNILVLIALLTSASAFAGFCFTPHKRINTCDPEKISNQFDYRDKNAYMGLPLMEFSDDTTMVIYIIMPKNAPGNLAGKITKSQMKFVRKGDKYEDMDRDGCIQRGSYKETGSLIVMTPKSQAGTCDSMKKEFFGMTKNQPVEYRKIFY